MFADGLGASGLHTALTLSYLRSGYVTCYYSILIVYPNIFLVVCKHKGSSLYFVSWRKQAIKCQSHDNTVQKMKYFIHFLSNELRNHLEIGQDKMPRTKQA